MIPVLKIPICQIYTVVAAPAVVLHFFLSFSQGKCSARFDRQTLCVPFRDGVGIASSQTSAELLLSDLSKNVLTTDGFLNHVKQ